MANQLYSSGTVALEELVVARPSTLHEIYVHNDDAATMWIHLWDAADLGDVDPSMDVGDVAVFPVAADWAGRIPIGKSFFTGIVIGASTTEAAGGTAPTALGVLVRYG